MTFDEWREKIEDCCKEAGTYRPCFGPVMDTLADILGRRDAVRKEFEENGAVMVVEHTNRGGATNYEQNPAIRMINDLNRDALAYWRDLGLTPAGLKKINDAALQERSAEVSPLQAALEKLA